MPGSTELAGQVFAPPMGEFAAPGLDPEEQLAGVRQRLAGYGIAEVAPVEIPDHNGGITTVGRALADCPHFFSAIDAHWDSILELTDDPALLSGNLAKFVMRTVAPPEAERQTQALALAAHQKKN
jgi:hypothetical protein